jgi:hypothetical protein
MDYGKCVSCDFDLKDGNVRSMVWVTRRVNETQRYCCNDTVCLGKATMDGWMARSYSGKKTINQPGEAGIFRAL